MRPTPIADSFRQIRVVNEMAVLDDFGNGEMSFLWIVVILWFTIRIVVVHWLTGDVSDKQRHIENENKIIQQWLAANGLCNERVQGGSG